MSAWMSFALGLAVASAAPVDRSKPPTLGAPKVFTLPTPVSFTLKNGVTVLFIERTRAPLIEVVANVEAGMAADPAERPGVSSWTSAMLLEGAGDKDALAFADAQASLGARIHTSTGPDVATVSLHVSAARFDAALALFADAMMRPRLQAADWARVKQNLLGDMRMKAQDPTSLAQLAAARAAWGPAHRFALDVDGTPNSLLAASHDDVRAFHAARYRPDTTTLIVVGAIDRRTLQTKLDAAFKAWSANGPKPERARAPQVQPRKTRGFIGVQVDEAPQTVLRVVAATPQPVLAYDASVEVMNALLGGSFTSRLNDNLREQHGYAYGASSRVVLTRSGSLFSVRTAVQASATVPAIGEVLLELERIQTPATEEEVTRAKNLVALSFPASFDNASATAETWAAAHAQDVDAARVRAYLDAAPKVDVAGVQRAAARAIDVERCTIVAVGDLRAHQADLARFGASTMWTAEDLLPGVTALLKGSLTP
jgi:zinc protease